MRTIKVTFEGLTFFSNPVFKTEKGTYLSSLDHLLSINEWNKMNNEEKHHFINNHLTIHGTDPDDDPLGTKIRDDIELVLS